MTNIPVVDLDSNTASQDIKYACENFGFFYVEAIVDTRECIEKSANFFQLPQDLKNRSACNKYNLGYTSFQDEILAPSIQSCGDTKEGYYIGPEHGMEGSAECLQSNVWPDEDLLGLANWKNTMLKYHADCCTLAMRIVQCIANALDLPSNYFNHYFNQPTALLRLLKYGTIISDPSRGIYGAGPHSDYGMITLLATNEVPGLQILLEDSWIDIPPQPNKYIVNLGDCLQILTNGKFKSTVHRVLIQQGFEIRYSIAFFFEPNRRALIEPLPEFISNSEGNQGNGSFEPFTYESYLNAKYASTHADYKLRN